MSAFVLALVLLAHLLPASQGMGCPVCGNLGRCCCALRAVATTAHCAMRGCPVRCVMSPSKALPAGPRAAHLITDRVGLFTARTPLLVPGPAGRVTGPDLRLHAVHPLSPPTPPPRLPRVA